jgi:hypothetical protein
MLSPDELRGLKINETIAKEAFTQVERRLADILDTKKVIEQKASTLFSVFVTISLAAFSVGGTAIVNNVALAHKAWPLFLAGSFFVVGAGVFVSVLQDEDYGTLGSGSSVWLAPGVIDSETDENCQLGFVLAVLVAHLHERISVSVDSNKKKYSAIRCGMWLGLAGAVVFALSLWAVFFSIF